MYLRHKTTDSLFIKYRRCIFGGGKAPVGAHLVAPSLDNTDSASVIRRNTDYVYSISRNIDPLYLIHRNTYSVYVIHRNTQKYRFCVGNTQKSLFLTSTMSVFVAYEFFNTEFESLRHLICIFETYSLYL